MFQTIKTPEQIVDTLVSESNWIDSDDAEMRDAMIAAVEADRAQRSNEVFVVLSEEGDVVDVTTSREWAEHQTRDDEDNPNRSIHEDTLWDGPMDHRDWFGL